MPHKFGINSPPSVKHISRKAFFKHALERVYTFFSAAAFFRAQKRIAKAIRFDQTALIHKEFVKVS